MITMLDTPIALATGATFTVLIAGIVNMLRGGPRSASRSNLLMRGRIIAQAIAIALIMAGFALKERSRAETVDDRPGAAAAQDVRGAP
jgi:hypothetical protein